MQSNLPAQQSDVLEALRQATARRHAVLDTAMPLADPDATLADYGRHLQLLHAWLAPLSRWLAGYADGPQDPALLPPRDYLAAIEADLAHPALAGVPVIADGDAGAAWPAHAGAAYRWGACYVLEGSQLGGAVLYKRLAQRLAPHPLHYLRGTEGGPGARWKGFMAAMRAAVVAPRDVELACRGAVDAFDRLIALRERAPS